jgi:hypothetical protein
MSAVRVLILLCVSLPCQILAQSAALRLATLSGGDFGDDAMLRRANAAGYTHILYTVNA